MRHEPWMAAGYLVTVLLLVDGAHADRAGDVEAQRTRLGTAVGAIVRADYAGERAELKRLAASVEEVKDPALVPYRDYWVGFALWRRAINGFNGNPVPVDLRSDLEAATAAFRRALAAKPGWIEPKIGLAGCGANLIFLAGGDEPRRQAVLAEFVPVFREIAEQGKANPRALWIVGGGQLAAPPPQGGRPDLAAATYRSALEAARREALSRPDAAPWEPAWGGPENLMSLAYVYTHTSLKNRALALAYTEGALAAVPHWHFVRDILLPQAQALPASP